MPEPTIEQTRNKAVLIISGRKHGKKIHHTPGILTILKVDKKIVVYYPLTKSIAVYQPIKGSGIPLEFNKQLTPEVIITKRYYEENTNGTEKITRGMKINNKRYKLKNTTILDNRI